MKCNVGTTDRVIRVLLGAIVIAVGMYFRSWWGALGLVPLATGVVGYCGLYRVLGVSTCKTKG